MGKDFDETEKLVIMLEKLQKPLKEFEKEVIIQERQRIKNELSSLNIEESLIEKIISVVDNNKTENVSENQMKLF